MDVYDFIFENSFYQTTIGNRNIALVHIDNRMMLCVEDRESECENEYFTYLIKRNFEEEISEILSENFGIEIRFCEQCGKPFDAGYTVDCGWWYCCEECFDEAMDDDYGEGNWRPTDTEGIYGGFYEFLDKSNNTWEDTGIYYTEWN